ncbi:hypothetical protein BaRGS_00013750 [Batillaria attramentaria]|uniref:Uncharacterized protein n=1 Tax=Batillaria attramentaria TaxID=370345 RepID=A0ABD0L6Z5_9CAEN
MFGHNTATLSKGRPTILPFTVRKGKRRHVQKPLSKLRQLYHKLRQLYQLLYSVTIEGSTCRQKFSCFGLETEHEWTTFQTRDSHSLGDFIHLPVSSQSACQYRLYFVVWEVSAMFLGVKYLERV